MKGAPQRRRLVPLTRVANEPGYEWATTRWLRRQRSERRLPFHKVPGSSKLLLDLNDLDRFVEQGRVEAADPRGAGNAGTRQTSSASRLGGRKI